MVFFFFCNGNWHNNSSVSGWQVDPELHHLLILKSPIIQILPEWRSQARTEVKWWRWSPVLDRVRTDPRKCPTPTPRYVTHPHPSWMKLVDHQLMPFMLLFRTQTYMTSLQLCIWCVYVFETFHYICIMFNANRIIPTNFWNVSFLTCSAKTIQHHFIYNIYDYNYFCSM